MKILQIRSEFRDNGPGTQSLEIAREMQRRGYETIFASSGGVLAEEIKKEFKHITIPTLAVNKRDPLSTFKNITEIRKILKKENIDVIHGHNAAATFTSYVAAKMIPFKKFQLTHSVRGMEMRENYQWRNLIYKFYPATFFAVSEYTKELLLGVGIKEKRIITTYNGVDIEKFDRTKYSTKEFRNEIGVDNKTILIGTVGKVNYNKGQEVLIKAIPFLRTRVNNFKIIIIGDGDKLNKCKLIAKELEVEEYVHFLGYRRDIAYIQAGLDIFVLASVKGEMFPNAILEAMAMGNPWVASSLSGIPEISENGKNGLLVIPNDAEDLSSKLEELITNEELRKIMGENSFNTIQEKYTISKICDKIETVYSKNVK